MSTRERKRYSLRNKMLVFNCFVTFAALLLGGVVFVVSVFVIVGKYIENDMDFFLRETNNNLKSKVEFLEEVIYDIRELDELMSYLQQDYNEREKSLENYEEIFTKAVDINSEKNSGGKRYPLLEKVYLFDDKGEFISTSYYAMLYSDLERSNGVVSEIRKRFINDNLGNNKDLRYYAGDEEKQYLAYVLYDDNMDDVGSVIFELRLDTINELMSDMKSYKDSMWAIYEDYDNLIYSSNMSGENLKELFSECKYEPYIIYINGRAYRTYYEEMSLGLSIISAVPENQITLLLSDSIKIYFIIILLIMIVAAFAFIIVLYYLTKPLKEVTGKLHGVKEGNFEVKLPDYSSQEFHEISETFNEMTSRVNYLIKQVYEKQLSIKELEVKFLQMQMNPHFMFNVLNMIALEAKMNNDEEVFKMISSFSQLLQAKIYRKDTEKVQVKQELEYVEYYLSLQSHRFGERLSYSIYIEDESLKECYIPKLCIQLIVENAVIHGIEPLIESGNINIKIYREDNRLFIDTIDNGIGFEKQGNITFPIENKGARKGHNHVGLNNTHNIIKLTYGDGYGISAYSKKGDKTVVRISIPIEFELEQGNGEDLCTR